MPAPSQWRRWYPRLPRNYVFVWALGWPWRLHVGLFVIVLCSYPILLSMCFTTGQKQRYTQHIAVCDYSVLVVWINAHCTAFKVLCVTVSWGVQVVMLPLFSCCMCITIVVVTMRELHIHRGHMIGEIIWLFLKLPIWFCFYVVYILTLC